MCKIRQLNIAHMDSEHKHNGFEYSQKEFIPKKGLLKKTMVSIYEIPPLKAA